LAALRITAPGLFSASIRLWHGRANLVEFHHDQRIEMVIKRSRNGGMKITAPGGPVWWWLPAIIASRFTRANERVDSTVYDHTSILKLIEWRWNLKPLTARDAIANNPAANFNFNSPDVSVPAYPNPTAFLLPHVF
jgi:Phosphoesterase family